MRDHVARMGALILYVSLYALSVTGSLLLPRSSGLGLVLVSAMVGSLVALAFVYVYSELKVEWKFAALLVVLGAMVDFLCNSLPKSLGLPDMSRSASLPSLVGLANLGMLTAAIGVGLLIAKGLRRTSYLVLAALVGATADCFSVFAGPTKHLVKTDAVFFLAFQWGILGQGVVRPIIGMGDFVFLSLFFAGARKLGWNDRRTLVAMSLALVLGLLSVVLRPQGLPALPFMALALLVFHRSDLKMSRRDWLEVCKLTVGFAIVMGLVVLKGKFM